MSIESNAAPDELDSPFYLANEKLCNQWNDYILGKGGKVRGIFNAWSFSVKGIVKTKREWLIEVNKATYSGGPLFFSAKKNLQENLIFKTIVKNTDCTDFTIKNGASSRHSREHVFFKAIVELLEEGFQNGSLHLVTFKKNELTVIFNYKNDWFEMADRILDFEF